MRSVIAFSCLLIGGVAAAQDATVKQKPLLRDFIGINGHTVLFKPDLYSSTSRLVRDYHPLDWDTGPDSDYKLDFPWARNRVNWETVYGSWKQSAYTTDACIMFETLAPDQWKDKRKDAYHYGQQFAKSFGPTSGRDLVQSVEIGNEPGKYSDDDYRTIFESMAKAVKETDSKIQVATCNVNVGPSGDYHKSVDCLKGLNHLYDALNIHTYAMLEQWPTWRRSFPEDARLEKFTGDVKRLIQWRDEQAPGKQIWITEFGWDCSTKSPASDGDFAKWVGNTDLEQAQWLVRSIFLFASMDVDRAYIYFFNDEDQPQLHGASGLTRNFEPKPSFYAVAHLFRMLGEYRFARVIRQNEDACVYEFVHHDDSTKRIWAAWSPTGTQRHAKLSVPLDGWRCEKVAAMPVSMEDAATPTAEVIGGELNCDISESPIYLLLSRNLE